MSARVRRTRWARHPLKSGGEAWYLSIAALHVVIYRSRVYGEWWCSWHVYSRGERPRMRGDELARGDTQRLPVAKRRAELVATALGGD